MVEAVVVLDPRLRVHTLNQSAARLAQAEQTWAVGRTLLEVFRNTELNDFARRLLSDPAPQEGTVTLEGPTYVQAHGARLRRVDGPEAAVRAGALDGIVLVLNDISRLRRLEEVRRDFVANVSHELKTPITAVKGYLDTLLGGALDDPKNARSFTETAAKHADRLGAIVDDLLSLSKLEERADVLGDVEPCEATLIARSVVDSFSARARQKQITLALGETEAAHTMGNPRLLEQALANLVDNAIKYTDAGGSVTVEARLRPPYAVLTVSDTGIGIAAKELPRVFERFYRVDKERSRDLGGTGLGLSVVRHIALAHGGTVEATSTPGQGSAFCLRLPLLAAGG
jgi:two-component system phosphate regulon sensor histidine kinase PhoR